MPAAAPWTTETAKQAAKRSAEARAARKQAGFVPTIAKPSTSPGQSPDHYVRFKLARTRKQLKMLDELLESGIRANEDHGKLDRIASAIEKLSRIEQNLAGRPGPGQYKPTAPPKHQHSQDVEPG